MKLKLSATMVTLALLSACGGGGSDDTGTVNGTVVENPTVDNTVNTTPSELSLEDRTRPAAGFFASDDTVLKSNGADLFDDAGPQSVRADRVVSWPGLHYGNFQVSNNPWNASAASFPLWYQDISLYDTGNGYGVKFDWDWGAADDTNGSVFDTKAYPEVIFGTKSAFERSGTFAETGLPVEIFDAPTITIDYNMQYEGRQSASSAGGGTDSEFNVAIESFFHDSCDVVRTGDTAVDNTIFEMMVWLKTDERKPAGGAPIDVVTTSDGRLYDVYTKVAGLQSTGVQDYIAFVAQDENLNGTVFYSELINKARDNAVQYNLYPLKDTDCLANILMGTEIWHGAGTFNLNKYTINRSY